MNRGEDLVFKYNPFTMNYAIFLFDVQNHHIPLVEMIFIS